MPENVIPGIVDDAGPIRYDWPSIKLLYVGGASVTDIARSLTKDYPDHFTRIQNTISVRAQRDEWKKVRDSALELLALRPESSRGNDSTLSPVMSKDVMSMAANTASVRKNRYLDVTTEAIDRAASTLKDRPINTLEEAAMAFKLMEPVHALARDVHGLSAKDGANQVQVNILSQWAGGIPEEETEHTSDPSTLDPS